MNWVRALDLENWANTLDSKSRFPQLVRRLVHATVEDLKLVEFPSGEGIQREGWDGLVEAVRGNPFVPSGVSVWESGTDVKISTKANKDFEKRKKDSRGVDQKQTTYIFVTPRKWAQKSKWCLAKNALGIWKEVRVYDSANIEEWLETAPSVDAWLAYRLGKRPTGITDIETHWANIASLSTLPLVPEIFLSARSEEIKFLEGWLGKQSEAIAYESGSPHDVIDFVSSYIASLDAIGRDSRGSRIVIVNEIEAWITLSSSRNPLVMIARPSLSIDSEMVAQALGQGHQVLVCSHRFSNQNIEPQILPRPHRYEIQATLQASGFDHEKAIKLARQSHRSLSVLKRLVCSLPSNSEPAWSRPPDSLGLVPILLAGGWDDALETDQNAIAKLAGLPYEQLLTTASRWLTSEDSPVLKVGSCWSLVSREDSWALLATYINRQDLDNFEKIAMEVLGEMDPRVGMDTRDRLSADCCGNTLKFSSQLRNGLAGTLALLGARADAVSIPDSIGPEVRASRVLNRLLPRNAIWQQLASLHHFLPLLAEAAPDAFLDAVEADLRRADSQFVQLFHNEGGSPFSSSPHTGLLWALETLVWNETFFARACLILARLDANDPGGKLANRPAKSLTYIFLPWFPQTTVSVEQRLTVLDRISNKEPVVGWKLLLSLLPNMQTHCDKIHMPLWREWAADWTKEVTNGDYSTESNAIIDRILANVGTDVPHWEELISRLESFTKDSQERILLSLEALEGILADEDKRSKIVKILRAKIYRNREFPYDDGSLCAVFLDNLENVQKIFEPKDLVLRHAWLFSDCPEFGPTLPREERQAQVSSARKKAISEIIGYGGVAMALDLARVVESPRTVGCLLGELNLLQYDTLLLPSSLMGDDPAIKSLAAEFITVRFMKGEWDWVAGLHPNSWSTEQVVILALSLPFERKNWDFIAGIGKEPYRRYWALVSNEGHRLSKADLNHCIHQYRESKRPFQAMHSISVGIHTNYELDPAVLIETLEEGLKVLVAVTGQSLLNHDGSIRRLIEKLQSTPEVDRQRLARLEWNYLRIPGPQRLSPVTLLEMLLAEPSFFADAIKAVHHSCEESGDDETEPTDEQHNRALTFLALLGSLHSIPGQRKDNTVDASELIKWITMVRKLCKESGRLKPCDSRIGQILAYSPLEPNGSWPCVIVREVIEDLESEEIGRGLEIGIINKRGVTSRSITAGGLQEWQLAATFEKDASICNFQWPATATVLRRIAKRYVAQAKEEDERLELI